MSPWVLFCSDFLFLSLIDNQRIKFEENRLRHCDKTSHMFNQLSRSLRVPSHGTEVLLFDDASSSSSLPQQDGQVNNLQDANIETNTDNKTNINTNNDKYPAAMPQYYVSPYYELFELSSVLASSDSNSITREGKDLLLLKFRTCNEQVRDLAAKNVSSFRTANKQFPNRVHSSNIRVVPVQNLTITFPQFPHLVIKDASVHTPREVDLLTRHNYSPHFPQQQLQDVDSKLIQVEPEVAKLMLSLFRSKTLKSVLQYDLPTLSSTTAKMTDSSLERVQHHPLSFALYKRDVLQCSLYKVYIGEDSSSKSSSGDSSDTAAPTGKPYISERDVLDVLQCAVKEAHVLACTATALEVVRPKLEELANRLFSTMKDHSYEAQGGYHLGGHQDRTGGQADSTWNQQQQTSISSANSASASEEIKTCAALNPRRRWSNGALKVERSAFESIFAVTSSCNGSSQGDHGDYWDIVIEAPPIHQLTAETKVQRRVEAVVTNDDKVNTQLHQTQGLLFDTQHNYNSMPNSGIAAYSDFDF